LNKILPPDGDGLEGARVSVGGTEVFAGLTLVGVLVGAWVEVLVGSATVAATEGVMFDPTTGSLAVGLAALLVS
jgi:hypothetical protein